MKARCGYSNGGRSEFEDNDSNVSPSSDQTGGLWVCVKLVETVVSTLVGVLNISIRPCPHNAGGN